MQETKGLVFVELLFAISVVSLLGSVAFAGLSEARLEARDTQRIDDAKLLESVLRLYKKEHGEFPKESSGANGNTVRNENFRKLISSYIDDIPVDPAGYGDDTYYYYYDGSHTCGERKVAVLITRQMDKAENANYDAFLNNTCDGVLDGEGRGGGTESYNIIVGPSSD